MSVLALITSVAQVLSPLLYAIFIVVIYWQLRAAHESVREVREEFLAGGRPVVAVHDEFDHASNGLSLAVENVGQGPAKQISFEFSRPIESSDGATISELPLFTVGVDLAVAGGAGHLLLGRPACADGVSARQRARRRGLHRARALYRSPGSPLLEPVGHPARDLRTARAAATRDAPRRPAGSGSRPRRRGAGQPPEATGEPATSPGAAGSTEGT